MIEIEVRNIQISFCVRRRDPSEFHIVASLGEQEIPVEGWGQALSSALDDIGRDIMKVVEEQELTR